jgi:hypothetical protein
MFNSDCVNDINKLLEEYTIKGVIMDQYVILEKINKTKT